MGPVLRLDPTLLVAHAPLPETVETTSALGEWGPLYASNTLLSHRFGWRARPYTQHVPKALSRSLLHEVSEMWPQEMARTAAHKFRGMGSGDGQGEADAYGVFLALHLGVERWREALLWSFIVARIGSDGDAWGELECTRAWGAVGGDREEEELLVKLTRRKSADEGRVKGVMRKAGYAWSDRTHYAFCEFHSSPLSFLETLKHVHPNVKSTASEDGYPYSFPSALDTDGAWPVFSGKELGRDLCTLSRACFSGTSAGEVFRRVAFEEAVACGDCSTCSFRLPAPFDANVVFSSNTRAPHPERTIWSLCVPPRPPAHCRYRCT